ncbi:MAG: ATP-dependent RecD-like DNA helicase [Alkaliphilus sp.]|nr:ATP-dependent RecD-like DNA helicase [Alkaliphilus sp. AH-315-G20]MBN4069831.1 ATP-dependent RecD-like DNA helicase [bacterium AH-315-G05]PHS35384.1 MAG: ATP-dependent RecD-like DNA helicase [Alkaliphilus sp.]
MIEKEGILAEIIFKNDSNGYTVALLECSEEVVTIVGCLPTVREGEKVAVKGKWKRHSNYGDQLEVKEYRSVEPTTEEGIISYLSSGIIHGIGKKMAERIVEKFGAETMDILKYSPQRLQEVSGIGKSKGTKIIEAFQEQRELSEIVLFLSKYGITLNFAVKIYKKYGIETIALIQENPYRLADEILGIGFKIADGIAMSIGIPEHSKYRISAAIKYQLNKFHGEGHTYASKEMLIEKTYEILNGVIDDLDINEAIHDLALEQRVHIEIFQDQQIVYSMPYYYAETNTCNKLIELAQVKFESLDTNIEDAIENLENDIQLASKQKEAIIEAMQNGLLVITGGPGTGKTTIINSLIKVFEKEDKRIILAAPTGRAAKRMAEATGREAKTIHRLLELGYTDENEGMIFQVNEDNPLKADVIIIDEVSMVDILLMNSLLKAIQLGTRLILVGDADQLPSVGAGNVLKDIIESNVVKIVRLTEIFRQARESMIVVNAHSINKGEYPVLNKSGTDFFFMVRNSQEDILSTLIDLVKERLPKHYKSDAVQDIQLLSPMKKGIVGTINLNKQLQNSLNPPEKGKDEKILKDKIFRVGDKVMQTKNNYTLKWESEKEEAGTGVFNGDIGYIRSINNHAKEMEVLFDEHRLVNYEFSKLDDLELAYCVTVHKSQGSEFSIVIIPMTWGPPMLLSRNLIYTAVTRAKQLVVMVGKEKYLKLMIDNNRQAERYSGLGFRLKSFFDFQYNR